MSDTTQSSVQSLDHIPLHSLRWSTLLDGASLKQLGAGEFGEVFLVGVAESVDVDAWLKVLALCWIAQLQIQFLAEVVQFLWCHLQVLLEGWIWVGLAGGNWSCGKKLAWILSTELADGGREGLTRHDRHVDCWCWCSC